MISDIHGRMAGSRRGIRLGGAVLGREGSTRPKGTRGGNHERLEDEHGDTHEGDSTSFFSPPAAKRDIQTSRRSRAISRFSRYATAR
jgi:hypothetical protein